MDLVAFPVTPPADAAAGPLTRNVLLLGPLSSIIWARLALNVCLCIDLSSSTFSWCRCQHPKPQAGLWPLYIPSFNPSSPCAGVFLLSLVLPNLLPQAAEHISSFCSWESEARRNKNRQADGGEAELRWKERRDSGLILCPLISRLSSALERWSALIPSSGSIFLCSLSDSNGSGQNRDSVSEKGRAVPALVFQRTFPSIISCSDEGNHAEEVGSVHTRLLETLVSLWHVLASGVLTVKVWHWHR